MRGFAGFGSAMLMAPIFAVLFGPTEMIAIVVTIELAVACSSFRGRGVNATGASSGR